MTLFLLFHTFDLINFEFCEHTDSLRSLISLLSHGPNHQSTPITSHFQTRTPSRSVARHHDHDPHLRFPPQSRLPQPRSPTKHTIRISDSRPTPYTIPFFLESRLRHNPTTTDFTTLTKNTRLFPITIPPTPDHDRLHDSPPFDHPAFRPPHHHPALRPVRLSTTPSFAHKPRPQVRPSTPTVLRPKRTSPAQTHRTMLTITLPTPKPPTSHPFHPAFSFITKTHAKYVPASLRLAPTRSITPRLSARLSVTTRFTARLPKSLLVLPSLFLTLPRHAPPRDHLDLHLNELVNCKLSS